MKIVNGWFEVRDPFGQYGLVGEFETEDEALDEINRSYERAMKQGYNNRNDKYITIWHETTREINDKFEFLKETTLKVAMSSIEFSEYDNRFVFVY